MMNEMLKPASIWGQMADSIKKTEKQLKKSPEKNDYEEVSITMRGPRSRAMVPWMQKMMGDKSMWNVEVEKEDEE